MALKLIYQVFAKLLSCLVLHARSDTAKEIEILVLRHQLIVLQRRTPVGCQNAAMVPEQRFQAAVSYSLMSPPRIGRRRILPWTGSGTGNVGRGGRN